MASVTRWILRHRLIVAAFWIVVALVGMASSASATKALSQQFAPPAGYEGVDTNTAILHTYGTGGDAAPLVPVIVLPRGATVATPGVRGQLAAAFAAVGAALPGARVISYASTGNRAFVSADGRTTFALVYPLVRGGLQAPPVPAVTRALITHPIVGAWVRVTGRDALASWSNGGGGTPGVLVPALVSLFGRWNWWLPAFPARLLRVQPSLMRTGPTTVSMEGASTASAAR